MDNFSGKSTGWRRTSPERAYWSQLADTAEIGRHSRAEIRALFTEVRPALHLRPCVALLAIELLDISREDDWKAGGRPIVWPANATLAGRLGVSESAMRRALNELADRGLVTFRDSANCKRWGVRSASAFGIDLSLFEARYFELGELAAFYRDEFRRRRELVSNVTGARRSIAAAVAYAREHEIPGPWARIARRLAIILSFIGGAASRSATETLARVERVICALRRVVEKSLASALEASKTNTSALADEHHIQPDKEPLIVICREEQPRADTREFHALGVAPGAAVASEAPSRAVGAQIQPHELAIDPQTVAKACPTVQEFYHLPIREWSDLIEAAECLSLGISPAAMLDAKTTLGRGGTAVALAIIAEKTARFQVHSPGGYLRGMIDKARLGQLRLSRSLRHLAEQA